MISSHGYRPVRPAHGETYQDNVFANPFVFPGPDVSPARGAPMEMPFKEFDPMRRMWHQGPRPLHNFKPKHYLTRPHDGKRSGAWGRLRDALSGQGADVFITTSGDKRTLLRDRPQRFQWSGWGLTQDEVRNKMLYDKDFRPQDLLPIRNAPWTSARHDEPFYNFRSREFESQRKVWRNPHVVWMDARWADGARSSCKKPVSYRNINGDWWSRVPEWAGFFAGGRPREPGWF